MKTHPNPSALRRLLALGCALAIGAAIACSTGADSPMQVYQKYEKAVEKRDVKAFIKLTILDNQDTANKELANDPKAFMKSPYAVQLRSDLEKFANFRFTREAELGGRKNMKENINGDKATIESTNKNGEPEVFTNLTKVEGKWRVDLR
jgi:hypothetical protein